MPRSPQLDLAKTMRVVQVNLAWDARIVSPGELLDRYHTLTGWSEALAGAGALVHVVQRFSHDSVIERAGIAYELVADGQAPILPAWNTSELVVDSCRRWAPDVVHVNGLIFPAAVRALRHVLPRAVIVVQDHSGALPPRWWWPLDALARRRWRAALSCVDAATFTSRELAARWHRAGLPVTARVLQIPEASTHLRPLERREARARSGVQGSPALLWVGRLDGNKDPHTVLAALERVLPDVPGARVTMVVPEGSPRQEVSRRIATSAVLGSRVTIAGPVPHRDMPAYYSAADVFVSGSHHEGSGYALIEALACGVVPCVTDIPAFRALAGDCGVRWRAGDTMACVEALRRVLSIDLESARAAVRRRFLEALSWPAVAARTLHEYSALLGERRSVTG
jgi:glycosyltransferase involved in cell wall biosynthesis